MTAPRIRIATATGAIIGAVVSVWMIVRVLPTDAQAAIAVVLCAPLATVPGSVLIGVARPTFRQAVVAMSIAHASVWLPLTVQSGHLGALLFGLVMLLPTLILTAPIIATTSLLSMMIGDVI